MVVFLHLSPQLLSARGPLSPSAPSGRAGVIPPPLPSGFRPLLFPHLLVALSLNSLQLLLRVFPVRTLTRPGAKVGFRERVFLPLMHLLPNLPQNSPLRNFSFLKQLPSPALVNSYISMYHHQHQCLLPILLHVSENFPNMNGGERSFMSCSLLFSQHLHSRLLVWF